MATNTATALGFIFSFNDGFVIQALDGLSHEELWRAPTDRNNSTLWVGGHVAQTRASVLQMLGKSVETGWGDLFNRGAAVGESSRYPSGADVERVMREVSPRLRTAISALSEEQLAKAASLPIPGIKTLADELAFFALHDSYHVGQMAYIRKGLGYPRIAG
ncbi:MAG TPA: DinB family protein [Terriglobales bacterium]|nr:DinB family protein [Terriglobales bacterium]